MNKIIIICGPTASGKSELAFNLAKKINSEIICADSMTVYKDLDIGTAKPSIYEQNEIKHHMINVVSPFDSFSVGDYKEIAQPVLDKIIANNKIPIVCGGTGFYINSLIYDLSYGNTVSNIEARQKYYKIANEFGNDYVYHKLIDVDPKTAKTLHPNDLKRVIRALEIFESGHLKSEFNDSFKSKYDYIACSIDLDRNTLYNRINNRVDIMIKNGLIDEVKSLKDKGLTLLNQSMQGIGYKEIFSFLNNEYDINTAIDKIKLNTRHYAKRQITFFKKLPNVIQLHGNLDQNIDTIMGLL